MVLAFNVIRGLLLFCLFGAQSDLMEVFWLVMQGLFSLHSIVVALVVLFECDYIVFLKLLKCGRFLTAV